MLNLFDDDSILFIDEIATRDDDINKDANVKKKWLLMSVMLKCSKQECRITKGFTTIEEDVVE